MAGSSKKRKKGQRAQEGEAEASQPVTPEAGTRPKRPVLDLYSSDEEEVASMASGGASVVVASGSKEGGALDKFRVGIQGVRDLLLDPKVNLSKAGATLVMRGLMDLEKVVANLALENANLRGRLSAGQGLGGMATMTGPALVGAGAGSSGAGASGAGASGAGASGAGPVGARSFAAVAGVAPVVPRVRVAEARALAAAGGAGGPRAAVLIRPKEGTTLTVDQVKTRVTGMGGALPGVRVTAVRRAAGGVVVETVTPAEAQAVRGFSGLDGLGLVATEPGRQGPRVVIHDVPRELATRDLLREVYERNLREVLPREEFEARIREVGRLGRRGQEEPTIGVVMEVTGRVAEAFEQMGRVFLGFQAHRVQLHQRVQACFRCLGYGHTVARCPKKKASCRKCGEEGHEAKDCAGW